METTAEVCNHPGLKALTSLPCALLLNKELGCQDCGKVFVYVIHDGHFGFEEA